MKEKGKTMQRIDTKAFKKQCNFKPKPKTKNAYDAVYKDPKTNKGLVLSREFKYDYNEMFSEKGISGECYKSFAKWSFPMSKDADIQELIIRRDI